MLQISLATMYSDRTAALFDGRVPIEGCNVHAVLLRPGEIFHRIFKFEEFDVAEMSLSSHLLTTARGDSKYVGIPAFPLRMFRHSGVYIRNDRGIDRPEHLRGKTVGLPEFQQTANVWVRGILQDQYGVDTASVHWRTGGLEEPGREERADIRLLKDIDWQIDPARPHLVGHARRGELDAVISPRPPPCFIRRDKCKYVDQLFPDYPAVELEYFKKTRIFPIMHVVGIRRRWWSNIPGCRSASSRLSSMPRRSSTFATAASCRGATPSIGACSPSSATITGAIIWRPTVTCSRPLPATRSSRA